MNQVAALRYSRLAMMFVITAALWGCGPGDDKGKDKKAEPTPPPPAPKAEAPKPKPAPKKSAEAPAAPPGGWTLLGQRNVSKAGERDRVEVPSGRFKELMVTVRGGSVSIDEMVVTFGNDKQHRVKVQRDFSANSSSQAIDLPGEDRRVKHVDFVYRTTKGKGGATIALYGR